MQKPYTPYIPHSASDIMDLLGWMMLNSPKFEDDTGYFEGQRFDTEFYTLDEGLTVIRKNVGEENYRALMALSDRMPAHFEADPNNETDDAMEGRDCIIEMEDILRASSRRKSR
ncbi:hypothetical protein [Sphingobium naphthae]|uniref:Uncharacterized protein n=1 Tax=Sphingobium naphthae TaxID=1886786 RepID=A0ABU3ZY80_9SPHN|nr:hypothetical protein [Sphingobium naphthae]MDV5824490.1 hypothetical protein [Sphingobium naphthae]